MEWPIETGIADHRIELAPSRLWISINTTVGEAETLLQTKYHMYEHETTGQGHVACEGSYSIPRVLSEHHVDLVRPTLHFDISLRPPVEKNLRRREQPADQLSVLPHLNLALYSPQLQVAGEDMRSLQYQHNSNVLASTLSISASRGGSSG